MYLKTLLLGTAAVVLATPALSADTIIAAEPEPVEYVRVCDAFGAGYFYIPGSETCLRLSGYVRMRISGGSDQSELDPDDGLLTNTGGDSYSSLVRARLNVDAKSDTEWGALTAHMRLQAQNDGTPDTAAAYGLDQAYIQVGGLFAGYSESAWNTTTNGGLSGFGGKGIYDGSYGYQQRNMLQYQLTNGTFFAAVSLEDDVDTTSWTPDIVVRAGTVVGGVTVFGVVGFDQRGGFDDDLALAYEELATTLGYTYDRDSQWGAKLGLNADVGAAGNFILQGFYASGPTSYGANLGFLGTSWTPEWSVLAAYGHDVSDTVNLHLTGQYSSDYYDQSNAIVSLTGESLDASSWGLSGGVDWTPMTNLTFSADVSYTSLDLNNEWVNYLTNDANVHTDWWNFALQLQRSF